MPVTTRSRSNTSVTTTLEPKTQTQTKPKTKPKRKTNIMDYEGTHTFNYLFVEHDCLNCGWNGLIYRNPCECPRHFLITGGETVEEIANIREQVKEFNRGPNEYIMK
jgi:hypothetical protein